MAKNMWSRYKLFYSLKVSNCTFHLPSFSLGFSLFLKASEVFNPISFLNGFSALSTCKHVCVYTPPTPKHNTNLHPPLHSCCQCPLIGSIENTVYRICAVDPGVSRHPLSVYTPSFSSLICMFVNGV